MYFHVFVKHLCVNAALQINSPCIAWDIVSRIKAASS